MKSSLLIGLLTFLATPTICFAQRAVTVDQAYELKGRPIPPVIMISELNVTSQNLGPAVPVSEVERRAQDWKFNQGVFRGPVLSDDDWVKLLQRARKNDCSERQERWPVLSEDDWIKLLQPAQKEDCDKRQERWPVKNPPYPEDGGKSKRMKLID